MTGGFSDVLASKTCHTTLFNNLNTSHKLSLLVAYRYVSQRFMVGPSILIAWVSLVNFFQFRNFWKSWQTMWYDFIYQISRDKRNRCYPNFNTVESIRHLFSSITILSITFPSQITFQYVRQKEMLFSRLVRVRRVTVCGYDRNSGIFARVHAQLIVKYAPYQGTLECTTWRK